MPSFPFDEVVRQHPWFHLAIMRALGKMLDMSTDGQTALPRKM